MLTSPPSVYPRADHNGQQTDQASAERYRSPPSRHHQTREQYQRAARHVHGHGHDGGAAGTRRLNVIASAKLLDD